jgi:hypothetical protein
LAGYGEPYARRLLTGDEGTAFSAEFGTSMAGVPFGISKPVVVTGVPRETESGAVLSSMPSLESFGVLSLAISLLFLSSLSLVTFFAFLEGCWPICEEWAPGSGD